MQSPWSRAIWPVLLVFTHIPIAVSGATTPAPTRGFEVDTGNRTEVVSFYQAIYMASEGYRDRIGWTGNYTSTAAGAEGTVSSVFSGDIERRVNYYRAMCGLKADVRVNSGSTVNIVSGDDWVPPANTTKAAASQRSALMIVRTYPGNSGLSHDPPNSSTAWTTAAWNANRNGNLALGFFGPGAVDAYFQEDVNGTSAWNVDVGHRRWLLFQWSTDFASGDTPGSFTPGSGSVRPPSNSMYVVPKISELDFAPAVIFATYPPAGFFPARLNAGFWSLSYPGGDFSAATVTLRDSASDVQPVTIVSRRTGYGDNSIVWQVPASVAAKSVTSDRTWNVTVSNIRGEGVPTQHSYQVILIDPDRLNETPVVSGNSSPVGSGSVYAISGVTGADKMEAGIFLRSASGWNEGAEDAAASAVVDRTAGSYPFRAITAGYVKSGSKAFRLTFPTRYDPFINGVPAQEFELGRELVPGASGTLNFQFRRGLMTAASKLAVETSDDGLTWTALGTPWSGTGGAGDSAFQSASLNLPAGAAPLRVRFRYYLADSVSPLYAHEDYPTQPTGIFIDDIKVSGCDWLEQTGAVGAPGLASFTLDATTAGRPLASGQEWWLRARAVVGGKAFPYGPAKSVKPSGPLQLSGPAQPPTTGADYSFIPDPAAQSYQLEVTTVDNREVWTEGAENSPPAQVSGATGAYALPDSLSGYRKSGSFAFRLGLSTPADDEDHFTIDRVVVPTAASTLDFWMRRGPMSLTNRLHVELSTDDGATWGSIWNLAGIKRADKLLALRSIPLAAWAGQPVKLRFAVRKDPGGANLKWNAKKSGVWIDDITVTSPSDVIATQLSPVGAAAALVRLDAASAGGVIVPGSTLRLRLRSVIAGSPGAWGPTLTVTPVAPSLSLAVGPGGFPEWHAARFPGLAASFDGDANLNGLADGIEYAFSLDPAAGLAGLDRLTLQADSVGLARDLPVERTDVTYGAEWSDNLANWSANGIEIRVEGGEIHASAPRGAGRRFLRWNIGLK